MTKDEFIDWLLRHGFAEERRGYGHATAEDIAEKLWDDGFFIGDAIDWSSIRDHD